MHMRTYFTRSLAYWLAYFTSPIIIYNYPFRSTFLKAAHFDQGNNSIKRDCFKSLLYLILIFLLLSFHFDYIF